MTRIFLFVLAIVTGVSPAQAASPVRAAQSEIGARVSVDAGFSLNTAASARTAMASQYVFALPPSFASSVLLQFSVLQNQASPFACTYRGDRTRQ